jgi:hypothetical protein
VFGDGSEQSTILRAGPDGLTRVLVRTSWSERESLLVDAREAERSCFAVGGRLTASGWGSRRAGRAYEC